MNKRRTTLLQSILRWAFYSIAFCFSALGIFRIVAIARQASEFDRQIQFADSRIAKLSSKIEALSGNEVLRASLREREDRNHEFIADYYDRCQDASDLPQLKTDFIVVSDSGVDLSPYGFVFSVPSGNHVLTIASEGNSDPVLIEIPLIPSAGYFLRFRTDSESEVGDQPMVVELTSNAPSFSTVRKALPTSVRQLASPPLNRREHLFYPNETYALEPAASDRGVSITSSHMFFSDGSTTAWLHVKVVSDSPSCVVGFAAIPYGDEKVRLQPYTGNGRFYIPTDKPSNEPPK